MTTTRTFTVVGGDTRQGILASLLQKHGQTVRVLGIGGETPPGCISCNGLLNAVHATDCVFYPFPVPATASSLTFPREI